MRELLFTRLGLTPRQLVLPVLDVDIEIEFVNGSFVAPNPWHRATGRRPGSTPRCAGSVLGTAASGPDLRRRSLGGPRVAPPGGIDRLVLGVVRRSGAGCAIAFVDPLPFVVLVHGSAVCHGASFLCACQVKELQVSSCRVTAGCSASSTA